MRMEFEDEHDDEQVEEEEEENDDESGQTTPFKIIDAEPITLAPVTTKYRECLKNHAVGIGGHALDGCGEFMQAGPEGSIHALKCAACNCHRNFHRKEVVAHSQLAIYNNSNNYPHSQFQPRNQQLKFYPYNRTMITTPSPSAYLQPRPMVLVPPPGFGGEDGGGSSIGSKKRSRTKFTAEQKEKMVEVAEKIGWKIHKEDEEIVQQFCQETGVKRHVFKVWLHNNKHTRGKKETLVLPSP